MENYASVIGSIVTVTVDRPMGSIHPKHRDIFYPINYGYVEGVKAPDGEWQDAYILGVYEPVKSFTGKVIAVIHRLDDVHENRAVYLWRRLRYDPFDPARDRRE